MATLQDLYDAAPSTEILVDGYDLRATSKGYEGTIRFWFAGSDLQPFTYTVTGKAQTIVVGGVTVTRLIPLIHPYISANCYADDVRVYPAPGSIASVDANAYTGTTGGTGGISFVDYFADVHFSTPSYQMESSGEAGTDEEEYPTVTIQLAAGEDRVSRPGTAYIFPSDGKRLNRNIGVSVKTIDFSLTMHKLPSINMTTYSDLAGSVNLTEFFGLDAGTVLYEGPECSGQFMIAGAASFDVTHKFKYRSIPHNEIMRDDGTNFEAPVEASEPTDSSTEDEDEADPRYLLPEGEHNDLWGV